MEPVRRPRLSTRSRVFRQCSSAREVGVGVAAAHARRSLAGALDAQQPVLDASLRRSYNVRMSDLRFAWDQRKETQNRRKHGVSFTEAETVFSDAAQGCEPWWSFTVIVKKRRSSASSQPERRRVVNGTSITEGGEHEEGI